MTGVKTGPTYIIAEAGVNHNGSCELALQLVDVAAEAGADAVKFQTFKAVNLVSTTAPKADYQKVVTDPTESQYDMVRKLELNKEMHHELITRCQSKGIQFLSTPFDLESLELLVHTFDIPTIKIPSGEITNPLLLLNASRTKRPIILSTGMCTLSEVEEALGVLAFGYCGNNTPPSRKAFQEAYCSPEGQRQLRDNVTLLHCTTEYPAPFADVNLRAMDTLAIAFGLPVGYSDHTDGIAVPLAAVARGAVIIEKHFTLDRSLPGPDHRASLEPDNLAAMIQAIRQIESALGSGIKIPAPSETRNSDIARKSLTSSAYLSAGEYFSERNVAIKRPGTGISPMLYWEVIGKVAKRDYAPGELIDP